MPFEERITHNIPKHNPYFAGNTHFLEVLCCFFAALTGASAVCTGGIVGGPPKQGFEMGWRAEKKLRVIPAFDPALPTAFY